MEPTYYPKHPNSSVVSNIPDSLPDYSKPVFTPKEDRPEGFYERPPMQRTGPMPTLREEMAEATIEYFDEPDYTREVMNGVNEVLNERPSLTRSEAEEQMHLTELRRLAEGYSESDATVISQVLAKRYPMIMFTALNDEYSQMKTTLDTITGAIKDEPQQ